MINKFINWRKNRDFQSEYVKLDIYLEREALTEKNFRIWLENIPFKPISINYSYTDEPFEFNKIAAYYSIVARGDEPILILGETIPGSFLFYSLSISRINKAKRAHINYGLHIKKPETSLIYIFLKEKSFITAFYYQSDYVIWQSKKLLEKYKYRGGLKVYTDKYRQKVVDLSGRPGRWAKHPKFNYCGASKMWFGPSFYEIIPQERIVSFGGGAVEIKVLENDVTYVHLYETVFDGDDPHNQKVQKAFREHLRIDEITQQGV